MWPHIQGHKSFFVAFHYCKNYWLGFAAVPPNGGKGAEYCDEGKSLVSQSITTTVDKRVD
jgi:hypothetical protein